MQRSEIGQPLRGDDRTDQERGKRGANQKESRHDRAHIDAHAVAAVHEQRRSSARPILSVSHIRIDEHEGERGRADEEPRTPDQGLREHRLEADFAEPEEVGGKVASQGAMTNAKNAAPIRVSRTRRMDSTGGPPEPKAFRMGLVML